MTPRCLLPALMLCLVGCTRAAAPPPLTACGVSPGMSRQDVIAVFGAPLQEDNGAMVYASTVPKVYLDKSGMVEGIGPADHVEQAGSVVLKTGDTLRKLYARLGRPSRLPAAANNDPRLRIFYEVEHLAVDIIRPVDASGHAVMSADSKVVGFRLGTCNDKTPR